MGGVDLRDATHATRCGSGSSSCRRRASSSPAPSATTCGSAVPTRPTKRWKPRSPRSVCADRFAALPMGLDTEVRERGSRLSGGERQLVSLARAALADPTILVLDEATSSLDPGTERVVELALDRLTENRTVIVVAHRLSTAGACRSRRRRRRRHPRRARFARRADPPGRALRRAVRVVDRGVHAAPRCNRAVRDQAAARRAPA